MSRYRQLRRLYEKYERWLLPAILLSGVTVDFITFRTIRLESAFVLLGAYLVLAAVTIAFIHGYDARDRAPGPVLRYVRLGAPLALQFAFGALLSASFIFYWFSGAFSVSWPILLLTAFLMASNDVFRRSFRRPKIQLTVYFFALFSMASLMLPFFFNTIAAWVFMLAGMLSAGLMYAYVRGLIVLAPRLRSRKYALLGTMGTVYLLMNGLYFTGIIPPIPLSIREAGVYHSVQRVGSDYILLAEDQSFLDWIVPGQIIHTRESDRIYVFSAIFAPARLDAEIAHHWFHYDEATRVWVDRGRPSFRITGGREGGYRGYTFTSFPREGSWRVDMETRRGQVLGRLGFRVEFADEDAEVVELIR